MKVCVIGAGPAGLTAAYQLARAGVEIELFEAGSTVGGMSRSLRMWGQTVDIGPHRFFSSDAAVNRLWLEVVQGDYVMVDRLTRILYQQQFFRYPLEPINALWNLGPSRAAACILSYLRTKVGGWRNLSSAETFESWVVNRFGRRLFETFFKSYSEKLWGISCQELDADFAAQRIKKLSLAEVLKSAFCIGKSQHRTLVDRFAYPTGGTGMVYERMAEGIQAVGEVHLQKPVKRVWLKDKTVTSVELADGRVCTCDHVISTMPLTHLVRGLPDTPEKVAQAASQLTFRNTIVVYLHVDATDLFPDQWVYVHSPNLQLGRITNFRNWAPQLYGSSEKSIIALEYWCYNNDSIWGAQDEQLIDIGSRDLRATGLIGDAEITDGKVVRVPNCYPVYQRGYRDHLAVVTQYLAELNQLTPIGRYGAFKYNNQDHSILMGMRAADQILTQKEGNLWEINTDYESYQEAAVIGETGLEPVAS
ncbi:MAG: FAD-dependent oxidoreductase [Pirellulales bacterium]|nr:FAD-dependent oxidoreductase [Pirellulales bacterium]